MKIQSPEINVNKCTGCGECVDWCPNDVVNLVEGKAIAVHPENCQYCADCEAICPSGAITCPFEIILSP
jgi:NAD-dependent dihydropyrimidine dehydrogenase PreA subunit